MLLRHALKLCQLPFQGLAIGLLPVQSSHCGDAVTLCLCQLPLQTLLQESGLGVHLPQGCAVQRLHGSGRRGSQLTAVRDVFH